MSATSSIITSATVREMSHARCGEPSRTVTVKTNDSGSALAGVRPRGEIGRRGLQVKPLEDLLGSPACS
jgi:hypothetical protein